MSARTVKTLVVEDNPGDVDLLRELFADDGQIELTIDAVPTLAEALTRLDRGSYDVILLDLALPDSFGFNTFSQVQGRAGTVPIVVLTVSNDLSLALTAVRNGAQDYLIKGQLSRELLGRVICYAIERKEIEEDQRFLARAGVELASSLDYAQTLSKVAHLVVPRLADCCIVDLARESGKVEQVAVAHVEPDREELLKLGKRELEPDLAVDHGVAQVLRTGKPEIYPTVHDVEWVAGALSAEFPQRMRELRAHSYMCIPLKTRQRTFGAITFLFTVSRRRFSASELALGEELARRAALAVENSRLFDEAQTALRSRQDLMAFVSHDLRTPLTAINMSAALIGRVPISEANAPMIRAKASAIERSGNRMHQLIETLLDLDKIESGSLQLKATDFDLAELLREAVEIMQPLAEKKEIELRCEAVAEGAKVHGDRERVLQTLVNLLGNAVKFTPAKGRVTLEAKASPAEVRFTVSDTGPGIAAEQLPKIFARNWQGRPANRQGAGLGLYISRGIVEAHGGQIWAESPPGAGARLSFTIPMQSLQFLNKREWKFL